MTINVDQWCPKPPTWVPQLFATCINIFHAMNIKLSDSVSVLYSQDHYLSNRADKHGQYKLTDLRISTHSGRSSAYVGWRSADLHRGFHGQAGLFRSLFRQRNFGQ